MKARELGPKSVVVGDHVRLVGDTTGAEGSLARIVGIEERTSVLVRTVDDAAQFERNIAANIDQLVIVAAATNPEPRRGLIDRFLVSAFTEGIDPILVITKTDLAPAPDFVEEYKSIGVKCLTTKKDGDLTELHSVLNGNVSVLVGHSGVGKSTLLNQLTEADREIGHVNDVTGRGRHTSSSAYAVKLKDFPNQKVSANSWVIDTPGVRAFGLSHLDPARIIAAFDDLLEITNSCMTNCSHNEADCKLNEWMAPNGVEIPERAARVSSLRNLLAAGLE
jgi:ribosome biogenesis GTPase